MRFRSFMAAGALALTPALALAGQADAQCAARQMSVDINGRTVPVKTETQVVQTAAGPMKISTWSWHSPHGRSSFEMQMSTGGAPPALALQQMQAVQHEMQAAQAQMAAMQQQMQSQMQAFQHATFTGAFATPAPQTVVFAMPLWAMPATVIVLGPAQHYAPPAISPTRLPTNKA